MGLVNQFKDMIDFKVLSDDRSVDTIAYIKDWLKCHPVSEIYIGCDSQTKGMVTTYVTTIVLHDVNMGCHILYNKKRLPKINSIWRKLWNEVEDVTCVGVWLTENGIKVDAINLDLNSQYGKGSNPLLKSAIGYLQAHGLICNFKPSMLPAIKAADNLSK